ncbi:hypothetical protein [Sphingobacterium siyangense]|uniref:hypothetical protein n=1 Tax=Sphingobacterium siyangense TaxID=459529 RepID=UPI0016002C6C|nr:hypothetical protein [Sphingobacterium siyangense]
MDIRKAVLSDAPELVMLTEQLGYPADIQLHQVISLETGVYVEIIGLVVDEEYRGRG